jgi:large subunit ribosomal protein L7/L12
MVEAAPTAVKEDATKEEAEQIKVKLEEAGATVEIK